MRHADGLSHHALFYRDQREYLACVTEFARAGLVGGEPVFIAVPGASADLLRDGLGGEPADLVYADMTETGRNPARVIPELRAFIDAHGGGPARIVTEPAWPGRSAAELREVTRHEALTNVAFAGTSVRILCLYAAAGLPRAAIRSARRTHPTVMRDGLPRASASYAGTGCLPPDCDGRLPPPPARAERLGYRAELRSMRLLVARHASGCGLSADRAASLVLAVGEIAANTLSHTDDGGTLHVWHSRTEIICQVQDQGWITDPLAGRRRQPAADHGHGLWVVHQVCDLVEVRTGRAGTTVRLHMSLA
jgi:anti-sigma regulatory factor (Ser/Thr protein kinase)